MRLKKIKMYFQRNLFFAMLGLQCTLHGTQPDLENVLISHVKNCIANGQREVSKLTSEILSIEGMSSAKVRHFLNNLCSTPQTCYLEIGCWKGSTFVAALYDNQSNISFAIGIDNWSQFGGPKEIFERTCTHFLHNSQYLIHSADCFKIDIASVIPQPITVYFYDGAHTALDQELAFTYYNPVLNDVFVAVVDDWNWKDPVTGASTVVTGTRSAFAKLGYEILFETILPSRWNCDTENWWNGLFVAVIRKPKA